MRDEILKIRDCRKRDRGGGKVELDSSCFWLLFTCTPIATWCRVCIIRKVFIYVYRYIYLFLSQSPPHSQLVVNLQSLLVGLIARLLGNSPQLHLNRFYSRNMARSTDQQWPRSIGRALKKLKTCYLTLRDYKSVPYKYLISFSMSLSLSCSILGPPALKYAAEMKQTLGQNTRPIYNYAMRGVVTCFTGIRKKDELVSTGELNQFKLKKLLIYLNFAYRQDLWISYTPWVVVSKRIWIQRQRIWYAITVAAKSISKCRC